MEQHGFSKSCCHIDYQQWIGKSGPLGEPIRKSKDRVLDTIHQETRLYLDRCNAAGGKGGASTNGLSVVSSSSKVELEKFKIYATELLFICATTFHG